MRLAPSPRRWPASTAGSSSRPSLRARARAASSCSTPTPPASAGSTRCTWSGSRSRNGPRALRGASSIRPPCSRTFTGPRTPTCGRLSARGSRTSCTHRPDTSACRPSRSSTIRWSSRRPSSTTSRSAASSSNGLPGPPTRASSRAKPSCTSRSAPTRSGSRPRRGSRSAAPARRRTIRDSTGTAIRRLPRSTGSAPSISTWHARSCTSRRGCSASRRSRKTKRRSVRGRRARSSTRCSRPSSTRGGRAAAPSPRPAWTKPARCLPRLPRRASPRFPATDAALQRTRLLGSPVAEGVGDIVLAAEAERDRGVPVVERLLEYTLDGETRLVSGGTTRTVRLAAKADRIDLLEDGTFRVYDYKLSRAPNRNHVAQLPAYAAAARQRLEEGARGIVAGVRRRVHLVRQRRALRTAGQRRGGPGRGAGGG